MSTKITRVEPSSAALPINPRTGRPFTSIPQLAAFENAQRRHGAMALAEHHLRNLKTHRR